MNKSKFRTDYFPASIFSDFNATMTTIKKKLSITNTSFIVGCGRVFKYLKIDLLALPDMNFK